MADNKTKTLYELVEFFRQRLQEYKDESRKSYRKTLSSFEHFVFGRYNFNDTFDKSIVENWYAFNRLRGLTPSMAYYYIDKLGNLYKAATKVDKSLDPNLFKTLREKIRTLPSSPISLPNITFPLTFSCSSAAPFPHTSNPIPNTSNSLPSSRANITSQLCHDLLLFSLYCGGTPMSEIVNFRSEDIDSLPPCAKTIANRYLDRKRKYLFPLDQSRRTKKQLIEEGTTLIRGVFPEIGIHKNANVDETLRVIWVSAALQCGILPSSIASFIGQLPDNLSFLRICTQPLSEEIDRKQLLTQVGLTIYGNPDKWFAMRLRPYVTYQELICRLSRSELRKPLPELFYPCDEIARKVGKKLVWKERPIIRDIIFFKTRMENVYPMFRNIWDIAWCYRDKASSGGYAVIPAGAMDEFRKTIGFLTPEYEVSAAGTIPLKPGEKIVIIDGKFANKEGIVLKQKTTEDGNIVYRVLMNDKSGNWDLSLDARLIKPL